ncbi:MAG: hypothetical protein MHMPM18_003238, partial [Marteilia pararefringens]
MSYCDISDENQKKKNLALNTRHFVSLAQISFPMAFYRGRDDSSRRGQTDRSRNELDSTTGSIRRGLDALHLNSTTDSIRRGMDDLHLNSSTTDSTSDNCYMGQGTNDSHSSYMSWKSTDATPYGSGGYNEQQGMNSGWRDTRPGGDSSLDSIRGHMNDSIARRRTNESQDSNLSSRTTGGQYYGHEYYSPADRLQEGHFRSASRYPEFGEAPVGQSTPKRS